MWGFMSLYSVAASGRTISSFLGQFARGIFAVGILGVLIILGGVSSRNVVAQETNLLFVEHGSPGQNDKLFRATLAQVQNDDPRSLITPGVVVQNTPNRITALTADRRGGFIFWTERFIDQSNNPQTNLMRLKVGMGQVEFVRTLPNEVKFLIVDTYNRNRLYWVGVNFQNGSQEIRFLPFNALQQRPRLFASFPAVNQPARDNEIIGFDFAPNSVFGRELLLFLLRGGDGGSVLFGTRFNFDGTMIQPQGPMQLAAGINPPVDLMDPDFGAVGLSFNPKTRNLSTLLIGDPSGDSSGALGAVFRLPVPLVDGGSPLPPETKTFDFPLDANVSRAQFVDIPNANPLLAFLTTLDGERNIGFLDEQLSTTPFKAGIEGVNEPQFLIPALSFFRGCTNDLMSEPDTDNDGTVDCRDLCPFFVGELAFQGCACPDPDDSDNDGIRNCDEQEGQSLIPPGRRCEDIRGGTRDNDGDGVRNCEDECPLDPKKSRKGVCGCEVPEDTANCQQECVGSAVNVGCGCGITDCTAITDGSNFLTEVTRLFDEPAIGIEDNGAGTTENITLTFQNFDGALLVGSDDTDSDDDTAAAENGTTSLEVRYKVTLQQVLGNKKKTVLRRLIRGNSVLLRRLSSGLYTAKYRAFIRRINTEDRTKNTTVSKSNFSPAQSFSL
jgi:hypothetical protein